MTTWIDQTGAERSLDFSLGHAPEGKISPWMNLNTRVKKHATGDVILIPHDRIPEIIANLNAVQELIDNLTNLKES